MRAFQGTEPKSDLVARLEEHYRLDQIVQGTYYSGGKGCAVGCATHDPTGGHHKYPELWGIPPQLAYLEDHIFESLSVEDSKEWPLRFARAIPVGADLSRVWDQWAMWMLRRLIEKSPTALPEVEVMASLFDRACTGDEPSEPEWAEAARSARAAEAARFAEAARAAEAARFAEAARAARSARAAEAARSAEAAEAAARNEWARAAADELVRLLEASPVEMTV
jgi:hypothetical protein